jgi:hypothetical protein
VSCVWMSGMSDSDSIDAPNDRHDQPESTVSPDIDPAIAEAVDGVANRFGAQGLEQMIGYAEKALADARAALEELADAVE